MNRLVLPIAALLMRAYAHRSANTVRGVTLTVLFALSCAVLGISVFAHFDVLAKSHIPSHEVATMIMAEKAELLDVPPPTQPIDVSQVNINQGVIAAHAVMLNNLQSDVTANKSAIAEQTNKLTEAVLKEAMDTDKLAAQQSLDEGRVIAGGFVLGAIWTIGLGILGFFHFGDRKKVAAA